MRARKILQLILGLVVAVAIAAVGLTHAYDRTHALSAEKAVIESDVSIVGTPFAGSISEILVSSGEEVAEGQDLLRLQSPTLQQARETARFNDEGVGYRIEGDDEIVFQATASGVVGSLPFGTGSFVPANTEITQIQLQDSMRVRAVLPMSAEDYSRLSDGGSTVAVTLPDGRSVDVEIYEVSFEESDSGVNAIVFARGDALTQGGVVLDGAPVRASLSLESDGVGAWAASALEDLVTPRGGG